MMNRYNFLRILTLAAGFGLVAYWIVFDDGTRGTVDGIGMGAFTCAGVCACWALIGIAERRARWRRFARNQPNARERMEMERERVKFRHALAKVGGMRHLTDAEIDALVDAEAAQYPRTDGHQPRATAGERVPPQGGSGFLRATAKADRPDLGECIGGGEYAPGAKPLSPVVGVTDVLTRRGGVLRPHSIGGSVQVVTGALRTIRDATAGADPEELEIVAGRLEHMAARMRTEADAARPSKGPEPDEFPG